ncbi:ABC transporter substrate-binding protein [Pseudomonas matsuisoli]|uniref:ABC transporter substrate-binding protein n=1 Tax=Pseudomonas matsuisoli TaxID=1515666 RepID=A0A917PQE0_9PSED|nr:ABC transporter substrate-binding protein [Pseudomonas matsuisoli]GGJ87221.1 ABC transporter substrate-binding protein [Pseudomonas matsuisoli]
MFLKAPRQHLAAVALTALFAINPSFAIAEDDVFDVVAPFEIGGLDPSISGFVFQRMQITETLLDADEKGLPAPGLAEKWVVSPDGKRWTFSIRPGVKFHDGSDLTAKAVEKSLNAALAQPGMLKNADIATIEAQGNEVIISLNAPFKPLSSVLAHSSTNILAPASYDAEGRVQKIIGTGPFKLTGIELPQRLSAERFEAYWGTKPTITKTTYLAAGRGETRTLMAESQGADMVFQLDAPSISRLKRSDDVQVLMGPVPRVVILKANAGEGATASVAVRQALSLGIQREGIAAAVLRTPGTDAKQMFADNVPAWHDPALAPLTFDPAAAKALLTKEGWTPGADGVLEKNGQRLHLQLLTYADRPELPLIATAVQAQLGEIGVDVEVSVTSSSAVPAAHTDGTLQLALYSRNYALVPDPLVTLLGDFTRGGTEWGPLGWNNPNYEKTMSALLESDDPAEQQQLRNKIVGLIQHDLPLIPIAWYRQSIAVSKKVEGAAIDPFERSFGLTHMRWAE